jgi:hypothetical protein
MKPYDVYLEAARLATKDGSFAVACKLYEKAILWEDDSFPDLRERYKPETIDFLIENLHTWTSAGRKTLAIKTTNEKTGLNLIDAKEVVEIMAERMNLTWDEPY